MTPPKQPEKTPEPAAPVPEPAEKPSPVKEPQPSEPPMTLDAFEEDDEPVCCPGCIPHAPR